MGTYGLLVWSEVECADGTRWVVVEGKGEDWQRL